MNDYVECNVDLHMHGLYSKAVSKEMTPKIIAEQAPLKGLHLIGSSDILHSKWCNLVKKQLKDIGDGLLEAENGTKFILQTEVEDSNRVHQIIFFPSFSKVEEVKERLKNKCKNFDSDGRPKIWVNGEELTEICTEADCLVGFAHAFTPYFGLYGKFNSYKDCFGDQWKNIHFLELGLSADTNMADRISELHNLTFTSNSDAHSPWPNKLGREFNRFRLKEISFDEIAKALKREQGRCCVLNVGFNPLEGKYHKTRCTGCLSFYDPKEAQMLNWRCSKCKKPIKKGVDFRIEELTDLSFGKYPDHRPEYKYVVPLSEIIALTKGIKNAWSTKVQSLWQEFVNKLGNEADILLNADINKIYEIDKDVAKYIGFFRENKIKYIPGGAGVYGRLIKPDEEFDINLVSVGQKSVFDF